MASDTRNPALRSIPGELPHRRRTLVVALVAVASLIGLVSILAVWVNRQALNTDNWTDTSSELLDDSRIREALSVYLVDQLYTSVDVEQELRRLLPPEGRALAGPAAGGLREFAQRGAKQLLGTSPVQNRWRKANQRAHRALLEIIDGDGGKVSTQGGTVTLDLRPLIERVGERIGIVDRLSEKLPEDAGQLEILQSDELDGAQRVARAIRGLAVVLPLLALLLYALAVYLAGGRRRLTLMYCGLGFMAAGLLGLVARRLVGDSVVDSLVATAAAEPAAEAAWTIGTSLLYDITVAVTVYGILIVAAAWLAGPARAALAARRTLAPYLRERPDLVYGSLAVVLLVVILWGPAPAFRQIISLLVIVGLVVLGVETLRRQTTAEFPGAEPGDTARRMRERFARIGGAAAQGRSARAQPRPGDPQLDRLERLAALRERGALSDEEFEVKKAAILGDS